MKFKFLNKNNLVRLLMPQESIGGLEVSDSALYFLKLTSKGDRVLEEATVNLSAGIIENGRIKDRNKLISALNNLKSQFKKKIKIIDVIVAVPSHYIYTQVFDLPKEVRGRLEEAVEFNLEAISPLASADCYRDWQLVGTKQEEGEKLEILGAFISAQIIDEYYSALQAGGFRPVAVEFAALALSRLFKYTTEGEKGKSSILVYLSSAGIEFIIVKEGELRFQYFRPWESLKQDSQKISLNELKIAIVQELERVINFYNSRYNQAIQDIVLIAPGLQNEVNQIIAEHFSLTPKNLAPKNFSQFAPPWFVTLGASLRGVVPRSFDTFISLMSVGTEKEYQQSRLLNFIGFWRNIFIGILLFFILIFATGEIGLIKITKDLSNKLQAVIPIEESEFVNLQIQAQKFNTLLSLAIQAKRESYSWSDFFKYFEKTAKENQVSLDRISVGGLTELVLLIGRAPNQTAAINFKNSLIQNEGIGDVDLPLTAITRAPDGSAIFQMRFKIKDLSKIKITSAVDNLSTTTSSINLPSATSSQ